MSAGLPSEGLVGQVGPRRYRPGRPCAAPPALELEPAPSSSCWRRTCSLHRAWRLPGQIPEIRTSSYGFPRQRDLVPERILHRYPVATWPCLVELNPTVQEGVLAGCWTVDHAIEVGAQHVGLGCNAYSSSKVGGKYQATQTSPEHMQGHRDFIAAARKQLRELANLRHTMASEGEQVPAMKENK